MRNRIANKFRFIGLRERAMGFSPGHRCVYFTIVECLGIQKWRGDFISTTRDVKVLEDRESGMTGAGVKLIRRIKR